MEPYPPSSRSEPISDGSLPVRVGAYRVVRRLATGGTSDVLLARAEGPHGFERVVVLKLLLQKYRDDEKFERMFAREAAAYARLSHPAIVKLYDFFADGEQLVMVLEYVDGLPLNKLRALMRQRNVVLPDRASIFIASRVFAALGAAHTAKDPQTGEFAAVIHRDVNPSNVLIPWDGHAKIADFGIAKVAGVDGETQAGYIKGTYGYMAPEQVRGESLTVRADVYAACLLLWELLAGRKAIVRATSDLELMRSMAEPVFPALSAMRPDLPKTLLDAVACGLEADPDRRGVSAEDLFGVMRACVNLEDGRRQLVDAMVGVRPPSVTEDALAVTVSHPTAIILDPPPTDTMRQPVLDLPADPLPDDTVPDPPRVSSKARPLAAKVSVATPTEASVPVPVKAITSPMGTTSPMAKTKAMGTTTKLSAGGPPPLPAAPAAPAASAVSKAHASTLAMQNAPPRPPQAAQAPQVAQARPAPPAPVLSSKATIMGLAPVNAPPPAPAPIPAPAPAPAPALAPIPPPPALQPRLPLRSP